MTPNTGWSSFSELITLAVIALLFVVICWKPRWRPNLWAHGGARFAPWGMIERAGMNEGDGLPIARDLRTGALIRLNDLVHVLLVGGSGSGKGVGILLPALLSWLRSSVVTFDCKGDLFKISSGWRAARGQRLIRLAPFTGGTDAYNVLDDIPADSPLLVDRARAVAAALVVRTGSENDSHWLDKAEQIICALTCCVLLRFQGPQRSLVTVQEIASDTALVLASAEKLKELGGVPGRLGNQILGMFAPDEKGKLLLTREGNGIMSTVARFLCFLDSELVSAAVGASTFRPEELLEPGISLFIEIPPELLLAQRGLLRMWIGALIRAVTRVGDETCHEVLFLLDEASALGSLPGLEEVLVRGRSAGCRCLLAYQSDSQVQVAFGKDKRSLVYDNCPAQIYLCPPSGTETSEALAKRLGEYTLAIETVNDGSNTGRSVDGHGHHGSQSGRSAGRSWALIGRQLARQEELSNMPQDRLVAFVRGVGAPILARRLSYFDDPLFSNPRRELPPLPWWLLAALAALAAWAISRGG